MLAYVGGNTSAFDTLYARHESALFRFVRRLLGVRLAAEADEVFQETWVRIISERESVCRMASPGGPGLSPSPTTTS